MPTLLEALAERPLLSDGAMGTMLQNAGLPQGACGEEWNVTEPEKVIAIQKQYVDAGSDLLITNTFGGCRIALARHGFENRVEEFNRAAVRNARAAFGDKPGFVIGDVGPFGGVMEPFGDVPEDDVREAFAEQIAALIAEGVDAILIETQQALEELGVGLECARDAGAPCIIGSMAFDARAGALNTSFGVSPEAAAEFMQNNGAHIVALNCGTDMNVTHAAEALRRYRAVTDLPLMAQPNAGQPEVRDGRIIYHETPQQMCTGVRPMIEAGARIVGACCGSTPEHIAAFRRELDEFVS